MPEPYFFFFGFARSFLVRGSESSSSSGAAPAAGFITEEQMRELQRRNLVAALEAAGGRISGKGGAAELLGIKPTTLADRMRALGIERPRRKA